MSKNDYNRGAIWYCNLPNIAPDAPNSIERGWRPVVITNSLLGSRNNDFVMVCALSSKIKDISINVTVSWSTDNYKRSQVLCNQIRTIPKKALNNFQGYLTDEEMSEIDDAMITALGIAPSKVRDLHRQTTHFAKQREDAEKLKELLPQAQKIIDELTAIISHNKIGTIKISKTGRVRRTKEEILLFVQEWDDPHNVRKDVIESFGFKTYQAAYQLRNSRSTKKLLEEQNDSKC